MSVSKERVLPHVGENAGKALSQSLTQEGFRRADIVSDCLSLCQYCVPLKRLAVLSTHSWYACYVCRRSVGAFLSFSLTGCRAFGLALVLFHVPSYFHDSRIPAAGVTGS